MKTLSLTDLEEINGGTSDLGAFLGGVACGASIAAAVGSGGGGWFLIGLGCASLFL